MTPLMYGAQHGNSSIVTTLLKGGALVSLTTHQGHTAARIAQDADYHAIAAIITQWGLQGIFKSELMNHRLVAFSYGR